MAGLINYAKALVVQALYGKQAQAMNQTFMVGANGFVQGMEKNAQEYADEGYAANSIVYACVDWISEAMGNLPWQAKQGDGDDAVTLPNSHPLMQLMHKPNAYNKGQSFWKALAADRLIFGNSYLEKVHAFEGQPPSELRLWSPIHMTVAGNQYVGITTGYVYRNGPALMTWDVDPMGESDLLQWKTYNPKSYFYGQSPMDAAAIEIDQHNAAGKWNYSTLENGCAPMGLMSTKEVLTDKQYLQIKERVAKQYAGWMNAGKTMMLEGGLEFQQVSMTPKDMDWLQGRKMSQQEIAAVYRVPIQLLGVEGSQTFANMEQARLQLYEDIVIPLANKLLSELNAWLVNPYYGEDINLCINLDKVEALEERRKEKRLAIENSSYMTDNEKRKAVGLDPIDDPSADILWKPAGLVPANMAYFDEPDDTNEADSLTDDDLAKMMALSKGDYGAQENIELSG